jgi:methyl-accepting chemotaxis protein
MEDTLKTVERLSQMAQEVSASNQRIAQSITTINDKSVELLSLIKDAD